jgi:ABC-type transporter Mla MlaB component
MLAAIIHWKESIKRQERAAMADTLVIKQTGDRIPILHLEGHLTAHTAETFMDHARLVKDSGASLLLVDLSGIGMITSAGLLALRNAFTLFTPNEEIKAWQNEHPGDQFKSPHFKLACASPNVYYVLSLAGFIQSIPIYSNLEDALGSFGL